MNFEHETLNNRIANLLSYVLHPLLMPTYLFTILYFLAPTSVGADTLNIKFKLFALTIIFVYTFVFPSISIYWFYKRGLIESMKMENLNDRKFPFFLTACIYFILGYFLYSKNIFLYPSAYIIWAIALVILLVAIISLRWQISAHAAGIGGVIGIMAITLLRLGEDALYTPLIGTIILAGYLLSARLQLNAHTPAQVGAGVFLGFVVSVISMQLAL